MRYPSLLLGAWVAAVSVTGALACGYHPGLANAGFDVVHPRSLSVAMAIRRATDRGVLEAHPAAVDALPTFASAGYRGAVRQLRGLEERLTRIAPRMETGESRHFAFVFVRSRLWARYTVQSNGARVIIHTPAADDGETVVLSDESVLSAILDERLDFDAAVEQGLLQFANDYGGKALHILRAALEQDESSRDEAGG